MYIAKVGAGIIAASIILLAAIIFTTPSVRAQECAVPVNEAISLIEGSGGEFLDLIDVPGTKYVNQLLFVELGGVTLVGVVRNNCMISNPIPLRPLGIGDGA